MGHRLSKIYTRTGDDGTTGLGDGSRVGKDSLRVEAYGTVDELNSAVGLVIAFTADEAVKTCLITVQHDLFDLGGELSIPGTELVNAKQVERLERDLDTFNEDLKPLKEFILPGGDAAAAACHMARTISRRAERRLITLSADQPVADVARQYLNRLSDLLFVVARRLAAASDAGETLWDRERYS
ncbi:MAG: cob(I)yrinic acid a,c-diamide adenosyltransferase [Pseudomonadota bacterium]